MTLLLALFVDMLQRRFEDKRLHARARGRSQYTNFGFLSTRSRQKTPSATY